ncbi:MAG: hypothetical protein HYS21_09595 [Deltaproteobacteria bacterium]|nr:hypothetical protein [Deltaproteobacteria bacterium]
MSLDLVMTIGGVFYGIALIWTMFAKNRFTEALRVDTLFMPNAGDRTRVVNLIFGIIVLGYFIYAFYRDYILK